MSLIDTTTAKTYMGVTSSSDDTLISLLIDLVQGEVEAYVDRRLEQTAYTGETLNYLGSNFDPVYDPELDLSTAYLQVYLKEYPVQSLTLKTGSDTISTDNYRYDSHNGTVTLYKWYDDSLGQFTANYTAGYTSATGSDFTIPNDLKLVLLDGVKSAYAASGTTAKGSGSVESKKVGDFSVTYSKGSQTITDKSTSGVSGVVKVYLEANGHILKKYTRFTI